MIDFRAGHKGRDFSKISLKIILSLMFVVINTSPAASHDLSGHVTLEGSYFFNDGLFPEQKRNNASLALQGEYYHRLEDGSAFTFVPFARLDYRDDERTHFDIREFNYLMSGENWELLLGVGKVFWGTTEFVHLVDIINQTDLIENLDGESKLGQPMARLFFTRQWGAAEIFLLPYFRERTFSGREGRFRFASVVDTDRARYESSEEERHVDLAIRYSNTIADADFGIYYFKGTGREPKLIPDFDDQGRPVLIPYYEQINQGGLDLQLAAGKWLWKLEALYRSNEDESFFSGTGGFEYTFVDIGDSGMNLGLIGELAYDERGDEATTSFENDVMLGLRLEMNDAASTRLLAGLMKDLDSSARILRIEASCRIRDNWKVNMESWSFFELSQKDVLYTLRDDDFIKMELSYYF